MGYDHEITYCMTTYRSYEIAMPAILPKIGSNYATRKQKPEKKTQDDLQHQDLSTEKCNYILSLQCRGIYEPYK